MNQPSTDELKEIKESLEQKMNSSSDSDSSNESSDSSNSSSLVSFNRKLVKKTKDKNYKYKLKNSENKLRYMQLEMVNKDIEISELQNKLGLYNKHELIINKVSFLFERLDNAIKVLNDRKLSVKDGNYIKNNLINNLTTVKYMCTKTQEKYKLYIINELYPLINDETHLYLKNSITALYEIKQKELSSISTSIDNIIYNTSYNNSLWILFFIVSIIISINSFIFSVLYLIY
jgi:hypothetical protein